MNSIKQLINDFLTRPPKGEYTPNQKRGKIFNILRKTFWKNVRPKYRKIRKGTIERSQQTITFTHTYKTFSLSIPVLFYTFYTLFFQISQFETSTSVMIENKSPNIEAASPLASLTGMGNNLKDLHLLVDYINSYTMLQKLDINLNLQEKYRDIYGIDIFSALLAKNTASFLRHYRKSVNLEINENSATLIIKYKAPTAFEAFEVLNEIVALSEEFLNETNKEVLEKEIRFYEKELENIMVDIRKMKHFLSQKQIETKEISPSRSFESASVSIMEIESELLKQRAELAQLESYLNPNALQVRTAKEKISSLQSQIKKLKKGIILEEQSTDNKFSSVSFATAEMELMLLMEKYKMVLQSLEQHKFNAIHKAKHLVEIAKPYEPDEPSYPNRFVNIIIFTLLYVMGVFIVKVTIEVIHEHKFY
jgi:capsular polysaccharide transport system permease protein